MDAQVRASEIALYLSDVEDEFSPTRLEAYTDELRDMLPRSAHADLDCALQQLQLAQASIRKAASRMNFASYLEGLHL